jgi:hypothetical protein
VPDGPPGFPDFVFHAGVLPLPPAFPATDRIVIRKATTHYNSWYRADALWISLSPRTSRELGVFLLACAFHGSAETTTLTISHPDSDIRSIVIPAGGLTLADLPVGLSVIPFALNDFRQKRVSIHGCTAAARTTSHCWR